MSLEHLEQVDPEVHSAVEQEMARQRSKLELIASENFVSPAVLAAAGTELTNKYAEGYPKKRYYGGCEYVDVVEELARQRLKALFGAEHANVQPHAGSQANTAVYFALLQHGDTVLGMDLSHGGHLTHGSPVNYSGKTYNFVSYGVDRQTELVDYDAVRQAALAHQPKLIIAGYSAYPRHLDFARFRAIADEIGAVLMVDMAHFAGLAATGHYPSPVPHAQVVTTTTHKTLRGPRGGAILCRQDFAERIDRAVFPGTQGGPLMHIIAAKAVAFKEAQAPSFGAYSAQVIANARALAGALAARGYRLVSGGTDNHLLVVNLIDKGITGKEAQDTLDKVGITTSRSTVPFDPQKPWVTSGIRLGTPAPTTRGMKEAEMAVVGELIDAALAGKDDAAALAKVADRVKDLTASFPLFA